MLCNWWIISWIVSLYLGYCRSQEVDGRLLQEKPISKGPGVDIASLRIPNGAFSNLNSPSILNSPLSSNKNSPLLTSVNQALVSNQKVSSLEAQNFPSSSLNVASITPNLPQMTAGDLLSNGEQNALLPKPHPQNDVETNAMKREEERYEATVLSNPKPKDVSSVLTNAKLPDDSKTKQKTEDEKLEQFVKQNAHELIKDLTPSERHIEIDDSEKDNSDDLKEVLKNANLQLKQKYISDSDNSDDNNKAANASITSLKSEDNSLKEYANLMDSNVLGTQHHHIESDTTDDQLALTEEEHLTKKLDFLKNKLKERQKLYQMKEEEKLSDENKQFMNSEKENSDSDSSKPLNKLFLNQLGGETNQTADVLDIDKDIPDKAMPKLTLRNITDIGRARGTESARSKAAFAFSYDETSPFGPPSWQILNPEWTCLARKQSPINIETQYLMDNDIVKNIIIKVNPPNSPIFGVLRNNGHAPTLSLSPDVTVKLSGGTLRNDYFLKQLHFHFGCENTLGSEHHINGIIYPLELHLVFWDNSTFATFPEAAKADDGIAVVAVLYQLENIPYPENKNTPLSQFVQIVRHIEDEGDNVTCTEEFNFRLEKLIPNIMNPEQIDRFYVYEGSLTTPGCYESVTWIVLATHPSVTENQLRIFRTLKSTKVNTKGTMCNNFRPVQKKNGRRIYSNLI